MNESEWETEETTKGSKGFYIALAICLLAVCGIAVATFLSSSTHIVKEEPTQMTTRRTTAVTTAATSVKKPVAAAVTDVPDDRTTTTVTKPTSTTSAGKAAFVFPVSNRILLPYTEELIYSETLASWASHNGVDFSAERGQAVKATADGKVTAIQEDALWGNSIEIDHGGRVVSRYYGVTAVGITVGDAVKAGQTIGTVSDIPAEIAADPHIHLEIRSNGKLLNPMTLIQGDAVTVTTAPKK